MIFSRPRESWQDPLKPVSGPLLPPLRGYTDVAIHYTSAEKIPANVDGYHRAMQNDYLTSRGFSLGYTCSVDMTGVSREIRGLDFRPAATRTANDYAFAILVLVDGDGMASPAACAEVRRIIGELERLTGRELRIRGHSEYVPTGCPGSGLRAQITLGEFSPRWVDPTVPPPPPPVEVVPPPAPTLEVPLYVIVGNADNQADPRRWLYNGFECRLLTEQDYNEARVLGWLHPSFNTLQAPFWKPAAWIASLGG